jgi:NADPH2:quinone reductase
MQPTMRAQVLERFGEPLVLREVPRPQAGPGQVLVRVCASGVNPLDVKIHDGSAPHARVDVPAILGIDIAGTIEEVGPEVSGFVPGDDVFGATGGVGALQGSLAEYAAVDAALLAHKPASLSMREAAALAHTFITAWEGLVDRAGLRAGQTVLIHGGAGGVGNVCVQLARALGATTFATGSAEDTDVIFSYGATPIDYRATSPDQYVTAHTGGEGFDVIYDTVGGPVLDASFATARLYSGHVVSALGWGSHSLAPLSFRGATYSGVFTLIPMLTGKGRAHHGEILEQATILAERGLLRPRLDPTIFHLETANEAHALLRSGATNGKLVVSITH